MNLINALSSLTLVLQSVALVPAVSPTGEGTMNVFGNTKTPSPTPIHTGGSIPIDIVTDGTKFNGTVLMKPAENAVDGSPTYSPTPFATYTSGRHYTIFPNGTEVTWSWSSTDDSGGTVLVEHPEDASDSGPTYSPTPFANYTADVIPNGTEVTGSFSSTDNPNGTVLVEHNEDAVNGSPTYSPTPFATYTSGAMYTIFPNGTEVTWYWSSSDDSGGTVHVEHAGNDTVEPTNDRDMNKTGDSTNSTGVRTAVQNIRGRTETTSGGTSRGVWGVISVVVALAALSGV